MANATRGDTAWLEELSGNVRAQDGLRFLLDEVRRQGLSFHHGGITVSSNDAPQAPLQRAPLPKAPRAQAPPAQVNSPPPSAAPESPTVPAEGLSVPAKGDTACVDTYVIKILDVQMGSTGVVEKVKVRYSDCAKWDRWLPVDVVKPLPAATNGDKSKRQRTLQPARLQTCKPDLDDVPADTADAPRVPVEAPTAGSVVDIFDVRDGWLRGTLGAPTQWGTVVRMTHDEKYGGARMVQMPLDFDLGDVRWPVQQGSSHHAEFEGKRLLVPASVFHQEDDKDKYAGIVKRVNCRSATVFFPIDAKEVKFSLSDVRNWVVESAEGEAEWRRQVPETLPSGWIHDVLFCSFPLQAGVDQVLLKKLCALSEAMQGVEVRRVPHTHRLHGSKFAYGLYTTKAFHVGHIIGAYAGCLGESLPESRWARRGAARHVGQYSINLDIAQSMGRAMCIEIDAKFVGNESRYINDYRGIAPQPNVELCTKADAQKGIWVAVKVAKDICYGEEILVNYGEEFTEFQ